MVFGCNCIVNLVHKMIEISPIMEKGALYLIFYVKCKLTLINKKKINKYLRVLHCNIQVLVNKTNYCKITEMFKVYKIQSKL